MPARTPRLGTEQLAGRAAEPIARQPETGLMSHRQIMVVFSGLMLGLFLAALDQSIVSTALPTIVGDFHSLSRTDLGRDGLSAHLDRECPPLRKDLRPLRP